MFSPGFPLLLLENKRESELPGETKGGEEENPNHANLSAGTIVVKLYSLNGMEPKSFKNGFDKAGFRLLLKYVVINNDTQRKIVPDMSTQCLKPGEGGRCPGWTPPGFI